jgi:hypothetical protein
MGAFALFLILIPGGILYSEHIERKVDACLERNESYCNYRMRPLNSPKKKRYLESLNGEIDPILQCEVFMKIDKEQGLTYARDVLKCDEILSFSPYCPSQIPSLKGVKGCRPRWV